MATFQSRAEVAQACQKILELEKEIHHLIQSPEELPLDEMEKKIENQTRLIEKIDFEPADGESLPEKISEPVQEWLELRKTTREKIKNGMEAVQNRLDSLDQSTQIMRHYMQGGMEGSESTSTRIDEEA